MASADPHAPIIADPATKKLIGSVPVGHLPYGVALDRSAQHAFVANWGSGSVSVVDLASKAVVDTVHVGLEDVVAAVEEEALVDLKIAGGGRKGDGHGLLLGFRIANFEFWV